MDVMRQELSEMGLCLAASPMNSLVFLLGEIDGCGLAPQKHGVNIIFMIG